MGDAPTPELDPDLLKETGRASAMQDVIDQAKALDTRGTAIEAAVVRALAKQLTWWKRAAKFAVVVILVLTAILIFNILGRISLNDVDRINDFIDNLCQNIPDAEVLCEGL